MVNSILQLLCAGCLLGASGEGTVANSPSAPLATVAFNWKEVASGKKGKCGLSIQGPLFGPRVGWIQAGRIVSTSRTINDRRYTGCVVYDTGRPGTFIFEAFVFGEPKRILIRAKSKIALAFDATDHNGTRLMWLVRGKKMEEPIYLPPGEYEIEVVGTDEATPSNSRCTTDSRGD